MNLNLEAIREGATIPDLFANLPKIPVASAISGLIVAAIVLMTPNSWFEAFIVETGLPTIVAAAEPPLGARARIVFALVAALGVTLAAWAVLSATVGRKMRQRAEARRQVEDETFDPEVRARALRRGDAHPDAPYREPIMAGDDLGVPFDAVEVEAAEEVEDAEDAVELAEAETEDDVSAEDIDALDLGAVAEMLEPEAEGEPEAEIAAAAADHDEELVGDDAGEPVFEVPLPMRAAGADEVEADTFAEEVAPAEPVAAPEQPVAAPSGDIAELLARFEAGLERKRAQRVQQRDIPENVTAHPQARPADKQDEALKEALDALQQVSGKAS